MKSSGSTLSFYAFCLILPFCGCSDSASPDGMNIPESEVGNMSYVEADDPEMAAAEEKAREALDEFLNAFKNPKPSQSDFAVKLEFKDGETSEHMWISDLSYSDGRFSGTLANEPGLVSNVQIGDSVTVDRTQVEDWMYYEGEEIIGGFTVKVLMNR